MSELWKPIHGYEGRYEVSSLGRVKSIIFKEKILSYNKWLNGYIGVFLRTRGGKGKQHSVHRLVAMAFCERKEGQNEVNHINEDKTDNRAENLEWCTRSENCSRGEKLLAKRKAWRNNYRSKAVKQYTLSGEFVKEYPSLHEVRRQTGFAESNIHSAIQGRYSQAYGYKWKYA